MKMAEQSAQKWQMMQPQKRHAGRDKKLIGNKWWPNFKCVATRSTKSQ